MTNLSAHCPRCGSSFEIVATSDEAVCGTCATSYRVGRDRPVVSLIEIARPEFSIKGELAEIDETIEATSAEIEELRSREQSGPLQLGCAIFGLFSVIILVLVFFMLIGKDYVGGWLFYLSLSAAIVLCLARIRRKLMTSAEREEFRRRRLQLESEMAILDRERTLISNRKLEIGNIRIDPPSNR